MEYADEQRRKGADGEWGAAVRSETGREGLAEEEGRVEK
jgi:hypothetical protein